MAWSAIVNFTKDDSGKLHIVGKTIGSSFADAQLAASNLKDFLAYGRPLVDKTVAETISAKEITEDVAVYYSNFHFVVDRK